MMIVFVMPIKSEAARWRWGQISIIIRSDVSGAVLGFLSVDLLGDIVRDAAGGSVSAAWSSNEDGGGKPYKPSPYAEESIGLHHNLALKAIIGNDKLSQLSEDIVNERLDKYLLVNKLATEEEVGRPKVKRLKPSDDFQPRKKDLAESDNPAENKLTRVEEVGRTKVKTFRPGDGLQETDKFIERFERAFEILGELDDDNIEVENPEDVKMKAVRFLKDGIRDEVRKELENLPFRKLQEIINSTNAKELKEGEERIYIINDKKVITDDIAYLIAADVLAHSFDFWAGEHVDKGEDNLKDLVKDKDTPPVKEEEQKDTPTKEFDFQLTLKIGNQIAIAGGKEVKLDAAPFIENDRTMVPLRFIGEQLGAEISWNVDERKVGYKLGDKVVELLIDNNIALVNGVMMQLDVNPAIVAKIRNDRTFVPVRFIVEALGFDIEWDGETQQVMVQDYNSSRSNRPTPIKEPDTDNDDDSKYKEEKQSEIKDKL